MNILLRICFVISILLSKGNVNLLSAQELGFAEKYSLGSNREAVLRELIPGTELYFYYHCLHCQTTGRISESRAFLDSWIQKFGLNDQNRRMLTRQFLLEYPSNKNATVDHLRSEFGISLDHPAPRKDEAAELTSKVPDNNIQWKTLQQTYSNDLNQFETVALGFVAQHLKSPDSLRRWIERIDRIDSPGLVSVIERELKLKDSRGFGWAPIHSQLSASQLAALLVRIPELIQSHAYVQATLRRIRPHDDLSLDDPMVMKAHLEAVEQFATKLPDSQNSLKATVLYHRLVLDEKLGEYNRQRFIRYLAFPIQRPIASREYLDKSKREPQVDLNANFQAETLLSPVGSANDVALVNRFLEHFFQADTSPDSFAPFIDRDYLRRVFATTKILYGIGDLKQAYAQLSPEESRELQNRVEVNFDVSNPTVYKPTDTVRLTLQLKNVDELIIRVYRVNARNVLSNQKRPIATDIDLDGLVANVEKRLKYTSAQDRRHLESIQLPELDGGGVWVVDAIAGGMRSRSLINKGHLHAIQFRSNSGDVLRVFDSDGRPAKNAVALYGDRQFDANENGEIIIPFAEQSISDQLILMDGPIATLQTFHRHQESYALDIGCLMDPQSMLSGSKMTLVMRPNLTCNGELVSLAQLEKPKLTVVTTDLDGISTSQHFDEVKLADSHEFVKSFVVPNRLATLNVTLSGDVLLASKNSRVNVSASQSISVNESQRTTAIFDFYLTKSGQDYSVEVRGRNGEPAGRLPVQLEFKLFGITASTSLRHATNQDGVIALGNMQDVQWVRLNADSIEPRTFAFTPFRSHLPSAVHALRNETIELSCSTTDSISPKIFQVGSFDDGPSRFSLIEYRNSVPYDIHSSKVVLENGVLQIDGLQPGSYRLTDHASSTSTHIFIVDGSSDRDVLIGNQRVVETNRVRPLHIHNVAVKENSIEVRIGNHDEAVRVHLVANAFLPSADFATSLPAPPLSLSQAPRIRIPSFYLNGIRLDEEYQYVLQRQVAKKYIGSLLPQPSVILNPWELSASSNSKQDAAAGDPLAAMAPPQPASNSAAEAKKIVRESSAAKFPDYEFLKRGSLIIPNLPCNDQGIVSIDRKLLEGLPNATLILVHPSITVSHRFSLPFELAKREYADRRLAKSFDATENLSQVQSVRVLAPNEKHTLGASEFTRIKIYSSIAEVFQLYKSLLQNRSEIGRFDSLIQWQSLTDVQKEVFYSDLACHELHLFLAKHDRKFFERVVKPHLANKLQKQFMDDYLLDSDLATYTAPWRFVQLNTVERVLLAKRLETQMGRTRRWLKDFLEHKPKDAAQFDVFFRTALEREALTDFARFKGADMALDATQLNFGINAGNDNGLVAERLSRELKMRNENETTTWAAEFFQDMPTATDLYQSSEGAIASKDKKSNAPSAGRAFSGATNRGLGRRGGVRLFESLESTRKWAESNYFRLPIQKQNSDTVSPNAFWLEYLNSPSDKPFVSQYIDRAASNLHEALMALAVLDLPSKSEPVELNIENGQIVLTHTSPTIAYVQGIQKSESSNEVAKILLGQDLFIASDPADVAKAISDTALTKGAVYRSRVVLTNPSATPVQLNLLRQIPQGAIALENAKTVNGQTIELAPFATQELNLKFYFPQAGQFTHYGCQVSKDQKHIIGVPSKTWKVMDAPTDVDPTSWTHISNWGTNQQVLEFLASTNLMKIDLDRMVWRMNDKQFFMDVTQRLEEYGFFHPTIWAYALKHDVPQRIREYLERNEAIILKIGPAFHSALAQIDPVQRLAYEHLDFRPLILARSHMLGAKRVILNDQLAIQYDHLMRILTYQDAILPSQRLSIVYFLLLQNRHEEAIEHFAKIEASDLHSKMQYDCFASYLDMIQGKWNEAELIARKYDNYPVPRWNQWFKLVRSHISDRKSLEAGRIPESQENESWQSQGPNRILTSGRDEQLASDNEKLPVLQVIQQGEQVTVRSKNVAKLTINYYLMDVELLFSRNPFAQQNNGRWNSIDPNFSETQNLDVKSSIQDYQIRVPDSFKNKSVAIEVLGGGLVRSTTVYANSLSVNLSPSMGRIQAFTKQQLKPLEGAYVKVYAKDSSGANRFYKDGYTDLRGQFDYASLSTNDLDKTQKFALLVSHPQHGTIVYEADPPKR